MWLQRGAFRWPEAWRVEELSESKVMGSAVLVCVLGGSACSVVGRLGL